MDLTANPDEVGSTLCFRERQFEPQNKPDEDCDGNGFIALVLRAPDGNSRIIDIKLNAGLRSVPVWGHAGEDTLSAPHE